MEFRNCLKCFNLRILGDKTCRMRLELFSSWKTFHNKSHCKDPFWFIPLYNTNTSNSQKKPLLFSFEFYYVKRYLHNINTMAVYQARLFSAWGWEARKKHCKWTFSFEGVLVSWKINSENTAGCKYNTY